jgi:uncharacterized protein YyaL (SSP411 family)
VLLPSAGDAAAWFVEAAQAAIASGVRFDAEAVRLLMTLAPGHPAIGRAIETVIDEPDTLARHARDATARLRGAADAHDENAAREIVTALELEVLRAYRPSHGLGSFENDAAVALAMLAAHDVGADEAHLMMAEELMLGIVRREWHERTTHDLATNCEAAVAFAALAARTGKPEYRERALEVMRGYAASYRDHGVGAAPYVSALQVIS